MKLVLMWFIIAILLGIVEVITVDLVSIWFVVGSLVAALLAWFNAPLLYQILALIIVSVSLAVITRPYCKKILRGNITPTNADRLIGKTGTITKAFDSDDRGEVKVLTESWTCTSRDKHQFVEGEKVKVIAIEGVKLLVTTIQ